MRSGTPCPRMAKKPISRHASSMAPASRARSARPPARAGPRSMTGTSITPLARCLRLENDAGGHRPAVLALPFGHLEGLVDVLEGKAVRHDLRERVLVHGPHQEVEGRRDDPGIV